MLEHLCAPSARPGGKMGWKVVRREKTQANAAGKDLVPSNLDASQITEGIYMPKTYMFNRVRKQLISLFHKLVIIRAIVSPTTGPKVSPEHKRTIRKKYLYQFCLDFTKCVIIVIELFFLIPSGCVKKVWESFCFVSDLRHQEYQFWSKLSVMCLYFLQRLK